MNCGKLGRSLRKNTRGSRRRRRGELDDEMMEGYMGYGAWSRSDCFKAEKGLLTFGWGRWTECLAHGKFKRKLAEKDVEDISRAVLLYCLKYYKGDDKIKGFIWDLITPSADGETKVHKNHSGLSAPVPRGRKSKKNKKEIKQSLNNFMEVYDWAKEPKYNPEILLGDEGYKRHLQRHANKVLLRVRLLYYVKQEVIGDLASQVASGVPASEMPIMSPIMDGDLPVFWWDKEADKSLLVGVYKHGYERYNVMRLDPTLVFLGRCGPPDGAAVLAELNEQANEDELDFKTQKGEKEDLEEEYPLSPGSPSCDSTPKAAATPVPAEPISGEMGKLPFPSASDLNGRLRRIITGYQRNHKKQEMKIAQRAKRLEKREKFEAAIREREMKKRVLQQRCYVALLHRWSRREEADFYRTVSTFGVEFVRKEKRYEWSRFRALARLDRKYDDTLTEYFKAFYAMCKKVCGKALAKEEELLPYFVEPITEERARRCLERIDLLNKIREEILCYPELDKRLRLCQSAMDMPDWWISGKHDKDLLIGAAKHGLCRMDYHILHDPELSFLDILKQHTQGKGLPIENEHLKIIYSLRDKTHQDRMSTEDESCDLVIDVKPLDEKLIKLRTDPEASLKKEKEKENELKPKEESIVSTSNGDKNETTDDMPPAEIKIEEQKDSVSGQSEECNIKEKEPVNEEETEATKTETEKEKEKELPSNKEDDELDNKKGNEESCSEKDDLESATKKEECKESEDIQENETPEKVEENEAVNGDEEKVLKDDSVKDAVESSADSNDSVKKNVKDKDEVKVEDKNEALEAIPKEVDENKEPKSPGEQENKLVDEEKKSEETVKATPDVIKEDKVKNEVTSKEKEASEVEQLDIKCKSSDKVKITDCGEKLGSMEVKKEERHDDLDMVCDDGSLQEATPSGLLPDDSYSSYPGCGPDLEPGDPTIAQLLAQSYHNPIRWPKDKVLQIRLEHVCHCVEKNEWPAVRLYQSYGIMGTSAGTPPTTEAESTPQVTPDQTPRKEDTPRETPTPVMEQPPAVMEPAKSAIAEALNMDLIFPRRRRRRRKIEIEAERAKIHAMLHQNLHHSPMEIKLPSSTSKHDLRSRSSAGQSSVSSEPPPAHQHTSARQLSSIGSLDLSYKMAAAAAAVEADHTSSPMDLSSSLKIGGKLPGDILRADVNNSDGLVLDLQLRKRRRQELEDELKQLKPKEEDGRRKRRKKLDEIVGTLSAQIVGGPSSSKRIPVSSEMENKPTLPRVSESSSRMAAAADTSFFNKDLAKWLSNHPGITIEKPTVSRHGYPRTGLEIFKLGRKKRRPRVDPNKLDLDKLSGNENVSVINRFTGKKQEPPLITGNKAPPLKHLATWLKQNPMFDVDSKWSHLVKEKGNLPDDLRKRVLSPTDKKKHGSSLLTSSAGTSSANSLASTFPSLAGLGSLSSLTSAGLLPGYPGLKLPGFSDQGKSSAGAANAPMFLPFGGLSNLGLTNPLFANLASFGFPGMSVAGLGLPEGKDGDDPSDKKTKSSTSSSTCTTSSSAISTTAVTNPSVTSAATSLPFLFPAPGLLYNPLGLGNFTLPSNLPTSFASLAQAGLLNGMGGSGAQAASLLPNGLLNPDPESDDESLKSLMGNHDDDDDLADEDCLDNNDGSENGSAVTALPVAKDTDKKEKKGSSAERETKKLSDTISNSKSSEDKSSKENAVETKSGIKDSNSKQEVK